MKKIKVLIIDDSKTMQQWLANLLSADLEIIVVGMASDPYEARELIKTEKPDVLTLDIIMPHMDGITFLKNLMRLHPMPVIMISKLIEKDASIALEALALGAIDYFTKPMNLNEKQSETYGKKLINSIKKAANTRVSPPKDINDYEKKFKDVMNQSEFLKNILIVIGASTGGIEALEFILSDFPKIFPPILIVQHIRKQFSKSLASRMNSLFKLQIKEAQDNDLILPGNVYIAPGGKDLCVRKRGDQYWCSLEIPEPMYGLRPINSLFQSAAQAAYQNVIGIILSGLGQDGTEGAMAIHQAGGTVIAQDEASSVAWGMPGSAVKANIVDYVVPLEEIPYTVFQILDILANN
jgi:two-component system, chemotaxis family, protein-glutamate methylesterase/glutaminase